MYGKYRVLGFTGSKTFVGQKGDSINYARVTLRDKDGVVVECKANPKFDFQPYLDKDVDLHFVVTRSGHARCEGLR